MKNIPDYYASMVFNDKVMKSKLPGHIYAALHKTMEEGAALDSEVADTVASAMKDWAISKGATHFTHWFQPMTGITAEKHDSFISLDKEMEFSGKELIKGEPDASSFPSGGLRATFEARGYTAWDPTSFAFVKEDTLYIPTAFCSYTGQILDKKTPLLRSMDALSAQARRVLAFLGKGDVKRVNTTVGPEQEYFLIDKALYDKRPDLKLTGRTLIGAYSPKGQELDDHYFGAIKPRVKAFMAELDEELWKLGIPAKTEHNEVAPSQHELAAIFESANIATDSNQLMMELMKKIALKHGLVCLLHEKPFDGINGSGKHNNWSISTDKGENLLDPGKGECSIEFMLFLTAVIKAVDDYQDLLRISVASAGNDHRLGANEAPPAIVSIFVGEELEDMIDSVIEGREAKGRGFEKIDISTVLPVLPKDNSDRNRTSPFAFTGNKFEFRMPGSSFNIACTNVMLNTAVAESLRVFADELEASDNPGKLIPQIIKRELEKHRRILFSGNGYSDEWKIEAEKRGLANFKTAPDAFIHFSDRKNIELFRRHGIYSEAEVRSREEISLDEYKKAIRIEALCLSDMLSRDVIPAVIKYSSMLSEEIDRKERISIPAMGERRIMEEISENLEALIDKTAKLKQEAIAVPDDIEKGAFYASRVILPRMEEARKLSDRLESMVDSSIWPYPSYMDLLFSV